MRAKEEDIRAAQTVESLLLSNERDFVLANGGRKVSSCHLCLCFTLPRNLDIISLYENVRKKACIELGDLVSCNYWIL